jgi:membrane-bound lytic murein transglycosylase D
MSLDTMKALNAAFRGEMIDANVSSHLMLPASHVEQFQAALLDKPAGAAMADSSSSTAASAAGLSAPEKANLPHPHPGKTHRVKRGESLWQIAHHFSIDVTQLQQWNHLNGGLLKPGQVLQLEDTD